METERRDLMSRVLRLLRFVAEVFGKIRSFGSDRARNDALFGPDILVWAK
jgi:hypothetical protein